MLRKIVKRNERKYNLIKLFGSDTNVEFFICMREVVFDRIFSSQIKSQRDNANF